MCQLPPQLKRTIFSLSRYPQIKWVKIFGSRARGDNEERSDFDLAVCFHEKNIDIWLQIQELLQESTAESLDIINYNNANQDIKGHIDVQGKIIFLNEKWYISLSKLSDALASLEQVIYDPDDAKHAIRDSVLTRFKYTIEFFWKTFKHLGKYKRVESEKLITPRDAIKFAYKINIIEDGDRWLSMLDDRNLLAHEYYEDVAEKIYERVKKNFDEMKKSYDRLKKEFLEDLEI